MSGECSASGSEAQTVTNRLFPKGCDLTDSFVRGILWDAHLHNPHAPTQLDEICKLDAATESKAAGDSEMRSNKWQHSQLCAMVFLFGFLRMMSMPRAMLANTLQKFELHPKKAGNLWGEADQEVKSRIVLILDCRLGI